jgi:hypothetical protein
MPYGCVPAWQREVLEIRNPTAVTQIGNQKLPAPYRSIGSIASAVKYNSNHWTDTTIVSQAGCDMGVMVLHANKRQIQSLCVSGCRVVRMEVMSHSRRGHIQERLEVFEGGSKMLLRSKAAHIPNMLAEDRFLLTEETEGIFELWPER